MGVGGGNREGEKQVFPPEVTSLVTELHGWFLQESPQVETVGLYMHELATTRVLRVKL